MKIGVVGCGFVGDAVANGFEQGNAEVLRYDVQKDRCNCNHNGLVSADLIFVCVPAPTSRSTGRVDTRWLEEALHELTNYRERDGIVVIKSTIPPIQLRGLINQFPGRYVYNPEFLSAKTAREDFLNLDTIVLGFDNRHRL
jgi:UDP-glucose 6-dehydrogenase